MADTKTAKLEREYVIPLRKVWFRVPEYQRTGKAVKAIKIFIAKHMKVADRDTDKVKLDVYLNNEIWYRGMRHPPARVKVKATKHEDGTVKVTFAETPQHVKFHQIKHSKLHKKAEKPAAQEKKEEKTEEQKTEEKEKEQAVAEQNMKEAKQQSKELKNVGKPEKTQHPQRMALKK